MKAIFAALALLSSAARALRRTHSPKALPPLIPDQRCTEPATAQCPKLNLLCPISS